MLNSTLERILVVDDDPFIRRLQFQTLKQSKPPVKIETAFDGQNALEKWEKAYTSDNPYALMFVDLNMPRIDGTTLIRKIREIDQKIAFIVLTGQEGFGEAYSLLEDCQISDFLQKALENRERLRFTMKNALEKRKLKEELDEQNKRLKSEIEEHKRAETELRKLSGVVTQSPADIMITNAEGVFEYVNPSFEKNTGYTKEELLYKETPRILNSGQHDSAFYKKLWDTISSGKAFYSEVVNKKKNGQLYSGKQVISPIHDLEGNISHFVSTTRNVTKHREEEVMQNEKLITLGIMASGVAHEVNNPNTFVRGNAQTLEFYWKHFFPILDAHVKENPGLKIGRKDFSFLLEDAPDLLKQIIEGTTRIKSIVNALSAFGHRSGGKVHLELLKVTEQSEIVTKARVRKQGSLAIDASHIKEGEKPMVLGDPSQLLQVLVNLINNALDSMEEANSISKNITLRIHSMDDCHIVEVEDTGTGINESVLPRLFDPFFTTKPVGKGTGLGLHICSNIVEKHEGKLSARNSERGGAIFEVQLPKA